MQPSVRHQGAVNSNDMQRNKHYTHKTVNIRCITNRIYLNEDVLQGRRLEAGQVRFMTLGVSDISKRHNNSLLTVS